MLLVAGRMVVSGSLSLGSFFAFNLLLAMLVMPLRMLGMWIGQAQRAIAAGRADLRGPRRAGGDRRPAGRTAVCRRGRAPSAFENVDFGYEPGRPVLEDIDLESGRADHRAHRAHRLRQDDARRARPALLRGDGGAGARGRHRRPRSRAAHRSGARSESSRRIRSSSRRASATTSPSAMPDAPHEAVEAAARAAQAHDFIVGAPGRVRDRRRRARDHALGRAAPAASRSRARCSSTRGSSSSTTQRPRSTRRRRQGSAPACAR